MTKPDISVSTTTQIRVQPHPTQWYVVESSSVLGEYGAFTISYWEVNEGKVTLYNRVYVGKESALAIADAIYSLFKEDS